MTTPSNVEAFFAEQQAQEQPKPAGNPPVKKWSFSAIKTFERCPYAIYLARVQHAPKPERDENHPAERGNRIHKDAELFVKGEGAFTKELQKCKTEIEELRAAYVDGQHVELEQQWGFSPEWEPVTWNDPKCWGMVKCDVVWHMPEPTIIDVWDYKTGKSFGNEVPHTQQMQLYAAGTFLRNPHAVLVNAKLVYLDEGKVKKTTYTRPQAMTLVPRIEARAKKLTTATNFPPKPNKQNCRFCDYSPNVGGTGACPYGVEV